MKTPEEELIERYVEAFNRHDIDDVMEFADGKIKEIRDYHQLASNVI